MNQSNPAHLLEGQKNFNPTRPTAGWWVKRIGSQVHLIKKFIFFIFSSQNWIIILIKI